MDKDDLVKRLRVELRRASPVHHYLVESELAGEAADRIEALETENARLKLILGNFMYAYGPHENLGGLPGVKQIWTEARAALGEKP